MGRILGIRLRAVAGKIKINNRIKRATSEKRSDRLRGFAKLVRA